MHFKISSNEQYYTGNTNNTFSVIFFMVRLATLSAEQWFCTFPSTDKWFSHWDLLTTTKQKFSRRVFSDIAVRRFTSLSIVKCSRLVFSWIAPKIEDSGFQKTLYWRKYTKKKKQTCEMTFLIIYAVLLFRLKLPQICILFRIIYPWS